MLDEVSALSIDIRRNLERHFAVVTIIFIIIIIIILLYYY